ncbi:MAG: GntR family transcriptional regulator [Lentisphaeria bacterium]|nr:GntR family transcriptional regulator [Lentisphaeria bacterium]
MKLVDIIRNDIENNKIVEDGKLPTLRQLAVRYQCGTTSVKRAFDLLEQDGIIRVVRGRGNFVIGHKDAPKQKKSKLIGTILLNSAFMCELAAVRDKYLQDGWLFSMYDASFDRQSPEKEKLFLRNAMKQNFSSFIITASPIEPVNTELFMQLRANGSKVIHLSAYKEDMSDECCFLTDYEHSASLAVWKIAAANYKNILYIGRENTAPHVSKIEKGIKNTLADTGLNLIDSFTVHYKESDNIIEHLQKLPPSTAILAFDTEIGEIVSWCAQRFGKSAPADFGLVSIMEVFGVNANHSYTAGNISEIVSDVLEYAIDEKISPLETFHKYYRNTFCDKKTL